MRIIAIGDIVGTAGVEYASRMINHIKNAEGGDMIVVNAENAAAGNGLDTKSAKVLLTAGADVLTGGNHTLRRHEVFDFLEESDSCVRPLNFPPAAPGKGFVTARVFSGLRVMVVNVIGQIFMDPADNPFNAVDRLLAEQAGNYDICVCDIHAEATSEKAAFARYFDGRIQVIFGTHTHVQTADERVLPGGSGFITDIGMCGPIESVLGVKPEPVIKSFTSRIRDRFEAGEGRIELRGAVFDVDTREKIVKNIRRIIY